MANKKDLVEAQGFARRRLLTAFTSGAPGGKELEPAQPWRAVTAGIALAVIVVIGGVFYGLLRPGLPEGWEDNSLLLVEDTGARYLTAGGTLHPVANTTSARLAVAPGQLAVATTDGSNLKDVPVGATVGIVGAPDDVPSPDGLIGTGWEACLGPAGVAVALDGAATPVEETDAVVVTTDRGAAVVVAGRAHALPDDDASRARVLTAIGLAATSATEVPEAWLALFDEGSPFAPLALHAVGEDIPGTSLKVGDIVESPGPVYSVASADGELIALSEFALNLYQFTASGGAVATVHAATVDGLDTLTSDTESVPADWPETTLRPVDASASMCATLTHDSAGTPSTALATASTAPDAAGIRVPPRAGALVESGESGATVLIDESGHAYPVATADDALARLGYAEEDRVRVVSTWLPLFTAGPELSVAAASEGLLATSEVASDAMIDRACTEGDVQYIATASEPLAMLEAGAVAGLVTGRGVTVAVIDSGVDGTNAHLLDAVVESVDLVDPDGEARDTTGHGTAVAGVIASRPVEGSAVVGLAPEATLVSARVATEDAPATPERLAQAIIWAADQGAQIVNVSLSTTKDDPVLRDAVAYAQENGALIVASAGNRLTTADTTDSVRYPAGYDGVLGVAALDLAGQHAESSIRGEHVDVAAPGQNVATATVGGGDCTYATEAASTSFATGYVSAAAALVAQVYPHESPEQWSDRLIASATGQAGPGRNDAVGWGRVQPALAVAHPEETVVGATSTTASGAVTATDADAGAADPAMLVVGAVAGVTVLGSLAVVLQARTPRPMAGAAPREGGLLRRSTAEQD